MTLSTRIRKLEQRAEQPILEAHIRRLAARLGYDAEETQIALEVGPQALGLVLRYPGRPLDATHPAIIALAAEEREDAAAYWERWQQIAKERGAGQPEGLGSADEPAGPRDWRK